MRHAKFLVLILFAALCLAPAAPAAQKAGVNLPDTVEVGDATLRLNGVALREKVIFDVYVAGLYLVGTSDDPKAILAKDAPRMMLMHFVRNVDAKSINKAWMEGLEANVIPVTPELRAKFVQLEEMMRNVKEGDEMGFTYTPATGTDVMVAGKPMGGIPGKDFADAILSTWIGPRPGPGAKFKAALLGGK